MASYDKRIGLGGIITKKRAYMPRITPLEAKLPMPHSFNYLYSEAMVLVSWCGEFRETGAQIL